MKILVVNRNYFITGGPEKYMFSLMENMPQHRFVPFCVDFEQNLETPYRKYFVSPPAGSGSVYYSDFKMTPAQKAAYALDSIYHLEARRNLERLIKDERPDMALFLNAVYFSDSIIDACRAHNVPIIWRMSDFHKVCANYLLYRDGRICEECLDHGLSRAIRNRCGGYQRSLGAALVKVAGMWLSRARRLYDHVDYFVTPSAFTREKMIKGGFKPEKIIHIPTFIALPEQVQRSGPVKQRILYVGRISHEKGLDTLLDAFGLLRDGDATLSVVGDDSSPYALQLKQEIPEHLKKRIIFHGFLGREQVAELFLNSSLFVVPSVWYENQPNVVLEGMAHECPIIVSRTGSLEELVQHGETGFLFEPGNANDLAAKMEEMLHDPENDRGMGIRGRNYVIRNHSLNSHLASLESLFEKAGK